MQCGRDPAYANVLFVSGGIDANENVYTGPPDSEQAWSFIYCPAGVVDSSTGFNALVLVQAVVWYVSFAVDQGG